MSYFEAREKEWEERLNMSEEESVNDFVNSIYREKLEKQLRDKEREFDEKKDFILRNVIHLLFVNENKEDLCKFHKIATFYAEKIKSRDLFAWHLGLYCVVNSIDCFEQEHGEVIGTLRLGETLYYEKPEEVVRITKTLKDVIVYISLHSKNKTLMTIPSFICCSDLGGVKSPVVGGILDRAWSSNVSDDEFWASVSICECE